ncbi:MAG: hypothetical protein AcusKO_44530 [Acuticoccus sp.]
MPDTDMGDAAQGDAPSAGLADVIAAFPDLTFAPAEGETFALLRPDSRTIALPGRRALHFKSADDARGCEVSPLPGAGGMVAVDASACTRETRLLCDLGRWQRCALLPAEPLLTVTLRAQVIARDADAADAIQWIRLLTTHGPTDHRHLALIDKKVTLRRSADLQSWTFEVPPSPDSAGGLLLAFQLAPRARPIAFGAIHIALNAMGSKAGRFDAIGADGIAGWLSTDAPAPATLDVRCDDGPVTPITLTDDHLAQARAGSARRAFRIPAEAIKRPFADADDSGTLGLTLRAGGTAAAFIRARLVTPEGAAGETTASDARPARVLLPAAAASAKDVAAADGAHIFEQLNGSANQRLTRETLSLLAANHTDGKLYRLHEAMQRAPRTGNALAAYAEFFFAKAMLAMNAADTAFMTLERLVASQERMGELDAAEQHATRLLLARAALYSGRKKRAADVARHAMTDDPLDWHCYFQLGQILTETSPENAHFYFRIVDALEPDLPDRERQALIERYLDRGEIEDALLRALTAMKASAAPEEYLLSLANIEIAMGRPDTWSRYVNRYFAGFRLQPPLRQDAGQPVDIFAALAPDAPPAGDSADPSKTVAIIIACHDAAHTIAVSVDSALAQSHRNVRVVVIDDNSSDTTAQIVETLMEQDERVILLRNDRNRGSYWSRNRGISEVDADFYTIHDADDVMHPARIAQHVAFMAANPEMVCSQSMWLRMERTGRVIIQRGRAFLHENPASTFLPKRLFEEIGYFDTVRAGADSELVWRLRHHYGADRVAKLALPLGIGLHHAGSITQSGAFAFDGNRYSAIRMRYAEAWVKWHLKALAEGAPLHVPYPSTTRPFSAPPDMLP